MCIRDRCRTHPFSSGVNKITAKLMPRWSGPFRITDFLTPVTVIVILGHPETLSHVKKSHVSSLKPTFHDYSPQNPGVAVPAY